MTLIDSSIWIGHFQKADRWLLRLIAEEVVLGHPFVTGEIACGRLADRDATLRLLGELPQAPVATPTEVLAMIESAGLAGSGIGYVDAHLLVATALLPPTRLWTADRRLADVARRLGLAMSVDG